MFQAFVMRPERIQLVQTRMLLWVFPSRTRTLWRFGFHRLRVKLWAWLTLLP